MFACYYILVTSCYSWQRLLYSSSYSLKSCYFSPAHSQCCYWDQALKVRLAGTAEWPDVTYGLLCESVSRHVPPFSSNLPFLPLLPHTSSPRYSLWMRIHANSAHVRNMGMDSARIQCRMERLPPYWPPSPSAEEDKDPPIPQKGEPLAHSFPSKAPFSQGEEVKTYGGPPLLPSVTPQTQSGTRN